MKNLTIGGVIAFASILAPQFIRAQGTMTYLSNLDQASAGSLAVGSNSWVAFGFQTGSDASGYVLNSVQMPMTDVSGNPSGFTVFLYSAALFPGAGIVWAPGGEIGTINNSLSPTTGGIYTFTAISNLTLAPNGKYFIVLTSGTGVGDGAYELSYTAATNDILRNGWVGYGGVWTSTNGALHLPPFGLTYDNLAQFALNATAIPEPGVLGLLSLGGFAFLWHRRKANSG
jgi:hypothetical protein